MMEYEMKMDEMRMLKEHKEHKQYEKQLKIEQETADRRRKVQP